MMGVIKVVVTGLASFTAIGSLLIESYVRVPQKVLFGSTPTPLPDIGKDAVFLLFPGFGGPDLNTQRIVQEVRKSDKDFKLDRFVTCYDWSAWCGNLLRAAFDSQRVGRYLGEQLGSIDTPAQTPAPAPAQAPAQAEAQDACMVKVRDLHVVGISVGAFAADACIRQYKKTVARRHGADALKGVTTRLTLLDPFTSRGVAGTKYGAKNFGLDADYFEHYLNTDDPVPSTNTPLPNGFTFDITSAAERQV
jgi:hypothetical protein